MESRQQLSNDNFSCGWLINIKPSFDTLEDSLRFSLDIQDGGSFIEMDPNLFSMRWNSDVHEFDFSLPSCQSPVLVHADQIFSNGLLLPLHLTAPPKSVVPGTSKSVFSRSLSLDSSKSLLSQSNRYRSRYFYAVPSKPVSPNSSPLFHSAQSTPISFSSCSKPKQSFFKSCVKSPKKILCKYLCFLLPMYKKVKGLRFVSRSRVQSGMDPRETSLSVSNALSSIEWCRGNRVCEKGSEKSIYDAVVYCKKSNGRNG